MAALLPDGTVNLTARECALLVHVERDILVGWRRDGIDPPDLVVVLGVMRESAARARLARPAHRGVVLVPRVAVSGSAAPELMLTAKQAADQLGISERAVTKAASKGYLDGRQVGRSTRWVITKASVDRYAPRSRRVREVEPMTEAEVWAELLEMQADIEQIEADVRELSEAS